MRIQTLLLAVAFVASSPFSFSQTPNPLGKIKRIYVDSLGSTSEMSNLRSAMTARLRKDHAWEVVDSPRSADATLGGKGEIWIRGYYSLNPRAGTSPSNGKPVYGGYVSVELIDTRGETIWSYLATLHSNSTNVYRDLAAQVVKHLSADFSRTGK